MAAPAQGAVSVHYCRTSVGCLLVFTWLHRSGDSVYKQRPTYRPLLCSSLAASVICLVQTPDKKALGFPALPYRPGNFISLAKHGWETVIGLGKRIFGPLSLLLPLLLFNRPSVLHALKNRSFLSGHRCQKEFSDFLQFCSWF